MSKSFNLFSDTEFTNISKVLDKYHDKYIQDDQLIENNKIDGNPMSVNADNIVTNLIASIENNRLEKLN